MENIKYELKYCERCGTLKLRPITSPNNYCLFCERMLARFRFPRAGGAASSVGLSTTGELKMQAGIPLSVTGMVASGRVQ